MRAAQKRRGGRRAVGAGDEHVVDSGHEGLEPDTGAGVGDRDCGGHIEAAPVRRRVLAALGPIVLPLDPSEGLERLHPAVRLQRPGEFVGSPMIARGHGRTQRRHVSRVTPNPGGGGPPGPERVEVEVETLGARAAVNGGAQGTVTEQVAVGEPVRGGVVLEGVAHAAPCVWTETFRCVRGA